MRKLTSFTLAILSAMLLTGCLSTKTVYVERVEVPEISFPTFPTLSGASRNIAERTVTVPDEWIMRLEEYHIKIKETEKNYNELKALYEQSERK